MSSLPHSCRAIEESATQQPEEAQDVSLNAGFGGKPSSIDGGGLRSPLEDADIFNSLFSKWGSDEAMEAAAVNSLEEYLFAEPSTAAAGGAGMQRSATPQVGMQQAGNPSQQQQQQQDKRGQQGVQGPPTAPCNIRRAEQPPGTNQQQQQQGHCQDELPAQRGLSSQQDAGAAVAAVQACMSQENLMVSAQSMQAMQAVLQMQQQVITHSAAGCMSTGSGHQQQQGQQQHGQQHPGHGLLAQSQPYAGPQDLAWQQFMMQQALQQQQQLAPVPAYGLGCPGPFHTLGAFGSAGLFNPSAAAAAAAAAAAVGMPGMHGLMNAPGGLGQQQWPQAAQPQQTSCFSSEPQFWPPAPAAGHVPHMQQLPGPVAAASAAGRDAGPSQEAAATVAGGQQSLAVPAPVGAPDAVSGPQGAAAEAATGNVLPALQPALPQHLLAALSGMPGLQGMPDPAMPGPAAAAAAASMLPGSWPVHMMGLLRPPSLPVPSVMQLALMMQAAAQAPLGPGGVGLQQTAMLVAAIQSMVSSNMTGMFGHLGTGMLPWQQQTTQQAHPAPPTQNNASCLGQFGQPQLMSQGTQGCGGQGNPQVTVQPGPHPHGGSHMGGSHMGGSHYVGSVHQTSTTGDYSSQAGDHPGAHSTGQWYQQQQHWPQQEQQQWQAGAAVACDAAAAAAELAAVEAMTPRHSKAHHKASHGALKRAVRGGESRRLRVNSRLRVKGRFVKKGTPGAAVAGLEPEFGAPQHTISDHEMSEGESLDEGGQHAGDLSQLMGGEVMDAATAAAAAVTDPLLLEGWGTDMQAAVDAAGAAAAANPPAPAAIKTARTSSDANTCDRSDPVMLVSPGNTASCWAEVVGGGFSSADPAWQAAAQQQQQALQLPAATGRDSPQFPSGQLQLLQVQQDAGAGAGFRLGVGGCAVQPIRGDHGHDTSRVERVYSSKRSWVTQQQLDVSAPCLPQPVRCDSTNTGPAPSEGAVVGVQQYQLQRSGSMLPGAAAGPCASDGGGGFPGLFSAPIGCLAAATAPSIGPECVEQRMHTCLHLCDSNRLAGPSRAAGGQQFDMSVGSKRKGCGGVEPGPREPSSAAAVTDLSRSGSLASSQVLLSPAAAAAGFLHVRAEQQAAVPVSLTQCAPAAATAAQASVLAATAGEAVEGACAVGSDPEVAVTTLAEAGVVQATASLQQQQQLPESQVEGTNISKRQKLHSGHDSGPAVDPAGPNIAGGSGVPAAVTDHVALSATDRAAAATAQMPPPAPHHRPRSATAATAPAGCAVTAVAASSAPASANLAVVPASGFGLGAAAACGVAAPAGGPPPPDITLLLQQAQQRMMSQPGLQQQHVWRLLTAAQQVAVSGPGVAASALPGLGLGQGLQQLQRFTGLPGMAGQLPQLLPQHYQPSQLPQLLAQQQQQHFALAGLWPTPAVLRPWGPLTGTPMSAALAAPRPLAPIAGLGVLPAAALPPAVLPGGAALLAPFAAAGLHAHHPFVAALNGAGAALFAGAGAGAEPVVPGQGVLSEHTGTGQTASSRGQ